jgi:hypothetical protein
MGVKVSFKFSIANLHSNEFPAAVQHFLRTVLACSPPLVVSLSIRMSSHVISVAVVASQVLKEIIYRTL